LIIVLSFSAGANLDTDNPDPTKPMSFVSGYDIAEIVCLFLLLINNFVLSYNEKKIVSVFFLIKNFFIVLCLVFPLTLVILKLVINSVNNADAKNLMIVNNCMRIFVLYFSLLYNVMDLNDVVPLFYTPKEQVIPLQTSPHVEEEKKKDRDCESNILVKQQGSPIISPKRNSFLNENSTTNRFPILLQNKVKLPIFISFELTSENDKGNSIFLLKKPSQMLGLWRSSRFSTTMRGSTTSISKIKYDALLT
jgi:hypothetical protein